MRTILMTLVSLCICIAAGAQFKNDLKRAKLKGRVNMLTEYEYNGSHDSLRSKSVTKYNEEGNAIEFFTYAPDGAMTSKTTFAYNDSGKITEENRYKADGTLNVKATYKYDIKGNKIEEVNYDATGTLFMTIYCKYDGKGNRIVKDSHNMFGQLFLKCNSKFDDEGHEISSREFDSHASLKYATTYDYGKDDSHGNWLQRTTYKNDDPFSVLDREIAYY